MSKRGTQRTRGNTKPTSSAKASATLFTQGISTFGLFSGELNISNGIDEFGLDNEIDPELRVILRKLTKKDSTTKIRAFGELRDYCEAAESDEKIRIFLPFFVSHYRKWSTDSDQRVRDECQATFTLVALRMKKNLSPHLKTILPSWLMAQCDSYAPAASKAKYLYQKLFVGEAKQADVVYFARNEIMGALTDEIDQCATALKDKKETEMETDDAHERRLTQALLALALFLNYFDREKRSELNSNFKTIFDSGKFWKLDRIKSTQIRISFYRCLFELISLIPNVLEDYQSKMIPLIFNSINETEPKLSPLIWDCLILCLDTFDDCSKYVHYQQSFLPKLYAFLRHACHGNVFGVKDCLLPLMQKIPLDQHSSKFIENFFQSLEEGILSIKGRQQMTNVSSLLKAYLDCLLYVLEKDEKIEFLNERLFPLIRCSLIEKDCSIRQVFARQYLHFLNSIPSMNIYRDHLKNLLDVFLDLINSSSSTSIDWKYFFDQSINLFETILSPPKLKNLRFAGTTSSSTDLSITTDSTIFQSDDLEDEKESFRIEFISELCRSVINRSSPSPFEYRSKFFTDLLLSSTSNQRLIIARLVSTPSAEIPRRFFDEFLRPLIEKSLEIHCSFDELVELTIRVLDQFQSNESLVEEILAELVQLDSSRRFYFLLTSIVCRYESSPAFHQWLKKHGVLEQLLNMTATVTKNERDFPVSFEEFQLLSSLLCSNKPTQYLTEVQQEQIVYLACRLFEEQCRSRNESEMSRDLFQSLDHVAKHLFSNIDRTYSQTSTQKFFRMYFDEDLKNVIRKNVELSDHHRAIWTLALRHCRTVEDQLINDLIESLRSNIPFQFDNDTWIDAFISIAAEHSNLCSALNENFFQRAKLTENAQRQSWIVGIVQGWLLPSADLDLSTVEDASDDAERFLEIQFFLLYLLRQNETNSFICSHEEFLRDLICNYFYFQSRSFDVKHLQHLFERLFRHPTVRLDFHFIDQSASKFVSELMIYHFYVQVKERFLQLNQREDFIDYTINFSNDDPLNLHLFLASFFRESQLTLCLPHFIEQCQDERRSPLTLAALNQCLIRMEKSKIILDEHFRHEIRNILLQSSLSSKELRELIQLWNTFLNHSNVINTLEHEHWDHLLCFLGNLFRNLTNLQRHVDRHSTLNNEFLFLHAANLLKTIGEFFQTESTIHLPDLKEEWLIVYSKEIYQGLLPLYIALPNALAEFTSFYLTNEMVQAICAAICTIPSDYLLQHTLRPFFHSDDHQSTLSESSQTVFNHLYRLLCQCPNRSLQYSSYHLLSKLLPHIAPTLITRSSENDENIAEDDQICRLPGAMLEALHRTEEFIREISNENDLVEEHLLDDDGHQIISKTSPTPSTVQREKEQILLSEFLNYKLLLNIIPCYTNAEQRYTYTLMLQQSKLLQRFLCISLTFIPANPVYNDPISMQISSITKKLSHSKSMFENEIQLNPQGDLTSPYIIPHLACSVYFQCLSLIPALVREWYHNQKKRIRDAVDRVTQKYVSPILIQQEFDSVSNIKPNQTQETGSFAVRKHPSTREITAIYTIETSRVEVCIRLPLNYPLNVPTIESTNNHGFNKDQWSQWMLQLQTFLKQNNGAVVDGLLHWKRSIDKKMQGIEECSICYCILHTNNDLPRRTCRTCKKKFHDACLFRWFRSSNKSTCPHCRANF